MGLLDVQSNDQLVQAEEKKISAKKPKRTLMDNLGALVRSAFDDAEQARVQTGVSARLVESRRQKSGIYSDDKAQAIKQKGGSQLFFNITDTKCEGFQAWMEDTFAPSGDRAWDLQPTPIPSLSEDMAAKVIEMTTAQFVNEPAVDPAAVQQFAQDLYDEVLKQTVDDARQRNDRMVMKIEDQIEEGGFDDALSEFFMDLSVYPTAIIKGPVWKRKKRLKWKSGKMTVVNEVIPTWCCVDPFNFFGGPNARNMNDSYLCEVIDFDRSELSEMREVDGWDAKKINQVLDYTEKASSFDSLDIEGETEMLGMENKQEEINEGLPDAKIRAIEYWGRQRGKVLKEWGVKGIKDNNKYYDVQCILIGDLVVKAVLNPDPLGRRPYFGYSYIPNKNSIWGLKSIPEKMIDCQEGANGGGRNLLNNLALASGPMGAVDIDAIPASHISSITKIQPWKIIQYHGTKTGNRQPISWFQPDSNARELIDVIKFFKEESDERTMIPRYVYGDDSLGGAGSTASGLSMMMNAASRGIKKVIRGVDKNVFKPIFTMMYNINMLDEDLDDSMKGDSQVKARGALAQLVKEQTQLRRQEFLRDTNNPTDLAITGMEGRATVLRAIATGLDLDVDKIVPPEEELRKRSEMALAEQGGAEEVEPQQQEQVQ